MGGCVTSVVQAFANRGTVSAKGFEPLAPSCVANLTDVIVVSTVEELAALPQAQGRPVIGTHDGTFHGDDVLACATLKMLPAYARAVIMRTRNEAALDMCDIVVDVGGKYEPERHRYDHHQRGFSETMEELRFETKLSSAGLVYRHFGKDFLRIAVGEQTPEAFEALYQKVYKSFMHEIDGVDNGDECFKGGSRNYEVTTTLSARVQSLNPEWNGDRSDAELNKRFAYALTLVGTEFAMAVSTFARAWWPARSEVKAALDGAAAVHISRQIVVLDRYVPYDSHLYELEAESGKAKYVLYPEKGAWRIKAVAESEGSFTSRLMLPAPWRGLKGAELSEKAGIEGCGFVHAGGFIGSNTTKDGAIQMALKALDAVEK